MGNRPHSTHHVTPPTKTRTPPQLNKEIVILQSQHNDFLVCQDQQAFTKELTLSQWEQVLKGKRPQPSQFVTIRWLLSGVPNNLRLQAWQYFTKADQYSFQYKYSQLLQQKPDPDSARQIELDLNRTFSKFSKLSQPLKNSIIEAMRRILRAYACYDRQLGYTQGINFLLANMLSYLLSQQHYQLSKQLQQRVLRVLTGLMQFHSYRLFFIQNTPKLFQMCNCLQKSVKATFPEIDRKIASLYLNYPSIFTSYYMTAFCYSDPSVQVGKKLIDLFAYLGPPVINSLVIKMMEEYQPKILQINETTELAQFFKHTMFELLEAQSLQVKQNFLQSALSPWRIAK